jgi:hypothetical protein
MGDSAGQSCRERRSRSIAPAGVDPAIGPAHARVVEREGRIGCPGAGIDRYFFSSCSDGSEALPGAWQSVCPLFFDRSEIYPERSDPWSATPASDVVIPDPSRSPGMDLDRSQNRRPTGTSTRNQQHASSIAHSTQINLP